jgi:mRNA interferase MazF
MVIKQYEIFIVSLDPTIGAEIKKTRPCVLISPDEMNVPLQTVQVAPMTSSVRRYSWRVPIAFQGKAGMIALDQIRTVDKSRLVKRVGRASRAVVERIRQVLREMLVD